MSASATESLRQRVSRACDLCRRKKVKCDGATPVCTNCKHVGLECTFKDMTKKRGPPKGYIEAIENRLYKLENFLAELAKGGDAKSKQLLLELNSPLETPTGEQIRVRPVRRAPRSERNKVFFWQQDKAGKRKRDTLIENSANEENTIDDEEEEEEEIEIGQANKRNHLSHSTREESKDEGIGQLSMDENGQVRYLGKSSGYYLLQNSRTYQNGAFHFANYGNRPRHQKTSRSKTIDPLELPPKDLSEHLIRLYFKHFYPFLPLFYKRQLYSTVDSPITESVTPLLLNAIYAIASRISPDARVRSDPKASDTAGNIFFERAEKLLDESYDTPSISTVQALLLLASHQHGIMKSARAWLYSGMAFRMAQDLGLHRNCDHWNIPPEECERRKRVFWCCYIVDRLSSAMYGRASTFEERDCDVPFPSVDDDALIEDDGEPDESKRPSASVRLLESFTNLIKICDILGHVLKNIYYVRSLQYAGIRQVDNVLTTWNKKLRQWYDQLPDSLQIKKENDHQAMPSTTVCQLHMIYHTTMILLHRPFIPGPNQSLIPTMLPCASICSAAADAVLSITDSMLAENKLRYVMNYSVYYIFTSGTIFIGTACPRKKDDPALLSSDNKSLEAKLKLRQCMLALDEIEGTWITASKSCQILAELSGFRDIDFQVSEQQEQYNHGLWQTTKPTPQIHFQHHVDSSSSHSSVFKSPQSSRTASPQPYHEPSHRTNNSNLRFPIVRIDPKNGQEDVASSNRRAHSNPQIEFSSSHSFQAQSHGAINNTTTNDPFAAQGVVSLALPRHYDPLGNTFWNMASSSLDDWNNFMNSNINNTPPFVSEQERQPFETANNVVDDYVQGQEKQRLIHTDQNVDMLSGVSVPLEESSPQNYLQHLNEKKTTASMDGRPSVSDLANAYYW